MSIPSSSGQATVGNPLSETNTTNFVPRQRPRTNAECGPKRFSLSPGRDLTERPPNFETSLLLFDGDEWECTIRSNEPERKIECKRLNPPDARSETFEGLITALPSHVSGARQSAAGLPMEGIMVSAIPCNRFHQSSRTKAKYNQISYDGQAQVWIPLTPSGTRFTIKCFPSGPEPKHDGFQCLLPSKGHRTDQSSLCISTGVPSRHIFYPYDENVVMFSNPLGGPAVFLESSDEEDENTNDEDRRDPDHWSAYFRKTGFGQDSGPLAQGVLDSRRVQNETLIYL